MAKTKIGVDIGSTAVRIAEVTQGDRPAVMRLGQVPLPVGAVEAGEVRDVATVTAALERLVEVSGVKPGPVTLGFASSKVVVREVALPWIPEKELRGALAFQVSEYIPMAPEEAVLDFQTISEGPESDPQRVRQILLVAAQKSAVLGSVNAARDAGLEPVSVDLAPFAAVRATTDGSKSRQALVDIGGYVTCIALHRGNAVDLVRILSAGGAQITSRLAVEFGIDSGVAELLKRGDADEVAAPGIDRERIRQASIGAASALIDEIVSTLDFSLRQSGGAPIAKIVVTGGGSHLEGILGLLEARLPDVEVQRARVFDRARSRLAPELGAMVEAARAFSVAIGLAMPELATNAANVPPGRDVSSDEQEMSGAAREHRRSVRTRFRRKFA